MARIPPYTSPNTIAPNVLTLSSCVICYVAPQHIQASFAAELPHSRRPFQSSPCAVASSAPILLVPQPTDPSQELHSSAPPDPLHPAGALQM